MVERSKPKSVRRLDLARKFVALGRLESSLSPGLTLKRMLVGLGITLLITGLIIEWEFQAIPAYGAGDVADRTIEAPRDFAVVDQAATQERRDEVLRSVPAVFSFDPRDSLRVASEIRMAFADAREVLQGARDRLKLGPDQSLPAAALKSARVEIENLLPRFSHESILDICLKYEFSQELEDQLVHLISQAMRSPVVLSRGELMRFQQRGFALRNLVNGETEVLTDWLAVRDLNQARDLLRQQEYELTRVSGEEKKELIDFLERWIVPNTSFDERATAEAERRALAEVDPVLIQVKQGRTIVRAGDEITPQNLSQLEALRRLNLGERWEDRSLGVLLVVLFFLFILWSFIHFDLVGERGTSHFALLVLVTLSTLAVSRIFISLAEMVAGSLRISQLQDPTHFYFLAPVALGSVLVMLLTGASLTIFFTLAHAVFIGLMTGNLSMAVYTVAGGLTAIYTLRVYRERTTLVKAGLWIGAVNVLVALAFQLQATTSTLDASAFMVRGLSGFVSGVICTMLASLVLPAAESIFGLTTDIRLLELSNLNSPILRRLALEAPGTYHHSITVGTLAEAGAEAIGANTLLIRVGAYYHDIGKLKHPEYYVENQIFSVNKHEALSPTMSSLILASHVKDGLAIAEEMKLGPKVASLIPQHHGTRIMTYFYQKAKEIAAEKNLDVSENDFRYPGPKPQSKEAAILMLADQVEAAARTLQEPTPGQIRSLINRITHATIQDGQFDECDITMKEVGRVARVFERVLTGMYHHRIDYPGFEFNKHRVEHRHPESQSIQ